MGVEWMRADRDKLRLGLKYSFLASNAWILDWYPGDPESDPESASDEKDEGLVDSTLRHDDE